MPVSPAVRTFWLCVMGSTLLGACQQDKRSEKKAATPAETAVPAAAKISQINVFVDMSGGMQGFVHPVGAADAGSGFQRTVTELLSGVNRQQAQQQTAAAYYFFKESTAADPRVLVPSTYQEMTGTVSGGLKNAARGSELPQMLSEALKLQAKKPGTVSVLISDFIFAPKDKSETWKIKTFIKDALNAVQPSDLAVSVFANTSDYRGNFYPGNRTSPQRLNGEKVPYYIWVLGSPELVAQADAGLLRPLAGQPQAHYNVRFTPPYAVLDYFEANGSWMLPDPGTPTKIEFTKKPTRQAPAEVVVGLDLKTLPPAQVAQASTETMRLTGTETAPATLARVWPLAQEPAAKAQPALARYSHFAKLRFERAPAGSSTLQLVMARPEPDWLARYSTDSDSNIKSQGPKTFHLQEVLAGVSEYFADEPSAQRLFSLPVQVRNR